MMHKLDKLKAELQALMRGQGEEAPGVEIVPENLDGEPVYGLEMLDENGESADCQSRRCPHASEQRTIPRKNLPTG